MAGLDLIFLPQMVLNTDGLYRALYYSTLYDSSRTYFVMPSTRQ